MNKLLGSIVKGTKFLERFFCVTGWGSRADVRLVKKVQLAVISDNKNTEEIITSLERLRFLMGSIKIYMLGVLFSIFTLRVRWIICVHTFVCPRRRGLFENSRALSGRALLKKLNKKILPVKILHSLKHWIRSFFKLKNKS